MSHSYYAKIENIEKLHYFGSKYVQWLNPKTDFSLIKEYFSCFGVQNDTDTYFGIRLMEIMTTYSTNKQSTGKLCGYIKNGKIVSMASVEFRSQSEWEICAVSTHPSYVGNGFSTAVCSFIAKYILEHNRTAICETHSDNLIMQAIMRKIGMNQYYPQVN